MRDIDGEPGPPSPPDDSPGEGTGFPEDSIGDGMSSPEDSIGDGMSSPEDSAGDGTSSPEDSAAARRSWLLVVGLILLAMLVVPGVVYRLTAPDPVRVTLAPLPAGASDGLRALSDALGHALDERPVLDHVPWGTREVEGADLVLELAAGPDAGAAGGTTVTARLTPWPDRTPILWEDRITATGDEPLAGAVARAVAEAVVARR